MKGATRLVMVLVTIILVFLTSVPILSSQSVLNSQIDELSLQGQLSALTEQLRQDRAMLERLMAEVSDCRERAARSEGSIQQFNTLFSEHARSEDRWKTLSSTMVAVLSILFAGGLVVFIQSTIQHQVEQRIGSVLEKMMETKAAAAVERLAGDVTRWMRRWDDELASLYREAKHRQ